MSDYILELNNITKNFPGVKALDNANFRLKKKSIHALLGENGAGKSTLIKIITGVYNQNEGKLFLNNQEKSFSSPNEAMNAGISVVHQERNLIRRFSVGENLMLTNLPKNNLGLIDYNTVAKESKKWLDIMELDIDPNTIVSDLTVAKMQLCEIAKALSLESKILLLDEPTSSLSPQDTKNLFALLKRLVVEQDVSIVFVSHKLEEVFEICDEVTVLRDGKNACESEQITNLNRQKLVKLMIGRDEQIIKSKKNIDFTEENLLDLQSINTDLGHKNINLNLKKGEILGLYGLVGAGRTELIKCVLGLDKINSGQILLNNKEIKIKSPKDALEKYKIGYISEDRKKEGLILMHDVLSVDPYVKQLEVKTPSYQQIVSNLSGGNQQKISVAKWLASGTDILFIDEPTVGIDIKTKSYLHELIIELSLKGTSIILITSDMAEMISLADRIITMKDFKVVGETINNHNYEEMSSSIMGNIHE